MAGSADAASRTEDMDLYSRARTLLEDMARAGNPASKDHEALLADVESMVRKLAVGGGWSGDGVPGVVSATANQGGEPVVDDPFWGMGWDDLLSSYAQAIWSQE